MSSPTPMAKIEEMFTAYCEIPSAAHIARACSIDQRTAAKYVSDGDPVRGIEPFVQRIRRVTRMAARRVEKKIAYRKADAHAAAWEHLQLLDDSITEALLDIRENMADRKPKLHEVAKAVQISVQLKTSLQKWAEEEGNGQDAEEFFAGWSEEQVTAFIESGTIPSQAIVPNTRIIDLDNDETDQEPEEEQQRELPEPQGTETAEQPEPVDAVDYDPNDVDKHQLSQRIPPQHTGKPKTNQTQKPGQADDKATHTTTRQATQTQGKQAQGREAVRYGASLEPGQNTPRTTAEGGGPGQPSARRRPRLRRRGPAGAQSGPVPGVSRARAPLSPPDRGDDPVPAWLEDEE